MNSAIVLDPYKRGIAEHFNSRTSYSRSESHARLADTLVRLAAPQSDERVLDVATGHTQTACQFASKNQCHLSVKVTVRAILKSGDIPVSTVAAQFRVARSTLYRNTGLKSSA